MPSNSQKVFKMDWEFQSGIDKDAFLDLKHFLDRNSDRKAMLSKEDIHPEMPKDGNLMYEVDELEEDEASIDGITWYQADPDELVGDPIVEIARDYLEKNKIETRVEKTDFRDLFETKDSYLNIYAIDGFTHGAVIGGDEKAVKRAVKYFERSREKNQMTEKAKELYRKMF